MPVELFSEHPVTEPERSALFGATYRSPVPSPDGTRLAWVGDRDGRPRLWLAALPELDLPVTEPDAPLVPHSDISAVSWSPDGVWLACELAPDGGERTRVLLVEVETGAVTEVAEGSAAVTLGVWGPNGHLLGVTVYAEGHGDGLACLVDLRDGTSIVVGSGPAARVCAISGADTGGGARHVVVRHGRRGARFLELVDLRTGRRVELVPGGDANVADARFGVTGGQLYVHTDATGDRPALLAVTVLGAAVSSVYPVAERPDDDLDQVALDPAGARAALVWNVDGRSEIELLDLRSGHTEPVAEAPGAVVTAVAFTRDGLALLVASEGPTVPPRLTRIELDGYAEHSALAPADPVDDTTLVAPTLHVFRGEDGLRLSGWLFRPPGVRGPLPTLIWLHGGPEAQERPTFQPLFQALVAQNVAVFAPNVRGSGGYGRAFATADDHDRRFVAITDVRATVTFLTAAGLAPADRVGVAGRSYGGYLTLAALARFPALFAVGVDVCGMSDFATFYADTEPWIARAATTKYGDPVRDAELLAALSPLRQVDRIAAPLLVVHGAHDTNVPLGEATQVLEALRERGASTGFLLFPDEGHEVHGIRNRRHFVTEVVRWVTAHLDPTAEQTA